MTPPSFITDPPALRRARTEWRRAWFAYHDAPKGSRSTTRKKLVRATAKREQQEARYERAGIAGV